MKNLLTAALAAALLASAAHAGGGCAEGDGCSAGPVQPVALTPYEKTAVDWAADHITKAGSIEKALAGATPRDWLAHGGFDPKKLDIPRFKQGVQQALQARGSELSLTRCAEYGACAMGTDLTEATGRLLAQYRREKSEDGHAFHRPAPAFTLQDLDGKRVSLSDYRGKRVALIFWQSHCNHSMQSLPVWDKLARTRKDVTVLTVLFNGGDASFVKQWYGPKGYKLPVLLAPSQSLADAYGTHLVPSIFLIDERGTLVKKLVTQQSEERLTAELASFARG